HRVAVRTGEVDALAGLAGVHAADDGGAGGEHPLGVLHPLGAGHALDDDLGIGVQEDCHVCLSCLSVARQLAAASSATRRAAPSMVSTCSSLGRLASARIRRPSSALLPSRRTTSGWVTGVPFDSSSWKACTMPLATASQAVIPPNTLTNTLLTCGSPRITSRPLAITSALAPPPMSRKLAGFGCPATVSPA